MADRLESVPGVLVGRRLAFDSAKGRLWVVCRKCQRWNLTPLKVRFKGEDARRVAAAIVPMVNGCGGSRLSVQRAVHEIEASGHPSRFLSEVASKAEPRNWTGSIGYAKNMPKPTRLALEMSLHEEQERRALEGELWILEQARREAEEIAAIADNLLLPARTDEFFDRHGEKP